MRTTLAIFLLTSLSLAKSNNEHPEWGPPPPVAPFGMQNLPNQHVVIPMIFPVLGASRWVDGYNANRGKFRHTGIDIRAAKMTPIVAPFSGQIGIKRESFWIYGDNGWSMLGTHMNDDNLGKHDHRGDRDVMFAPNLEPGQHVAAGQFIGYVGESGDATAPHLHFEIYAPGQGPTMGRIRNPFPSLKAARVLASPLPAQNKTCGKPAAGQYRIDGCIRRCDPDSKKVTLIMTSKQMSSGQIEVLTKIRYAQVKLDAKAVDAAGGWETIMTVGAHDPVTLYVDGTGRFASRLVIENRAQTLAQR